MALPWWTQPEVAAARFEVVCGCKMCGGCYGSNNYHYDSSHDFYYDYYHNY